MAAVDDLDRLSLAVAMCTLEAETESPGSQNPSDIEVAKQILAQLQHMGQPLEETCAGSTWDSPIARVGSN